MNIEKLEELTLFCKKLNLIYVVENKNVIDKTLAYFQDFFNEVTYTDNGHTALEEFAKKKTPIIITDIDIDGLNGFQLIENIKNIKNINKNIITI